MDLSPTAYVILGLLATKPRTGYEIKNVVDHSTRFFWAASYGQIYPELRKLSEAGLVEGADKSQGGRKRTEFALTGAGRKELQDWLRSEPETLELRDEGLLKLFFSGAVEPDDAVATLEAMREQRLEAVEQLREIEPMVLAANASYPLIVLRFGIEMNEREAEWCERAIGQLRAEAAGERSA